MRPRSTLAAVLAVLLGLAPAAGCAQSPGDAGAALRAGRYEDARRQLRPRLTAADRTPEEVEAYFDTFLHAGDYEAGLDEAATLLRATPGDPYLLHARGRLLVEVGRYEEAERAFAEAGRTKTDYHQNALALADLLRATGRRGPAQRLYGAIYQRYRAGEFRTAADLAAGARAAAAVEDFHEANTAFRTAYQLDGTRVDVLRDWADLFRTKYNDADAQRTYEEALALAPGRADLLVGLARATGSFGERAKRARQALESNPNHVGALSLLTSLHLLDGRYDEADALVDRALAVNPAAVEAWAHRAALAHLRGDADAFEAAEAKALAVNPLAGDFYATVVEDLALRFRYPDAAVVARKGVEADPENPRAQAALGTALLRLGKTLEARRHLERSFRDDPFNLFVGNTLRLLDEYEDFALLEGPNVRLLIHNDERDVLGPAMLDEAEAAYAALRERYPYVPEGKLMVEAYNDAGDFAVRVAGVPHLGLLGVSFGDVVALNTPRAQAGTPYNWARTLWHELAHTMAIGLSQNHVPRWFTEGLSVYEEQRARPAWGREMDLEFFAAFDRDALLPLGRIDEGFTRPTFPGQVLLSYYHASKVIAFIAEAHGFEAIPATLEALAEGVPIGAALERATGRSLDALDAAFRADLRRQRAAFAGVLDALPDVLDGETPLAEREAGRNAFLRALREGRTALAAEDYGTAETRYREALDLYPAYTGPGNAYLGLAAVYRAREEAAKRIDVLERYLALAEHAAEEARELGTLYAEAGRTGEAATALARSLDVDPYDLPTHEQLAALYEQQGRHDRAVRHRRAALALGPVDEARAYYDLARSLYAAADPAQARRAVLMALERAPGFRDAQKLLLRIANGD